jgi:hypothetical protein
MHATARKPADADALAHPESLGIRTDSRDPTNDFMAESRGILRNPPFVVPDRDVGVAQTTVFDSDFDILGPERPEVGGFEHHWLMRRLRGPGLVF